MSGTERLRILMSAGEVSGDVVGARIAQELCRRAPGCQMYGLGGANMLEAGVDVVATTVHLGSVGLTEGFAVAPGLFRCWRRLRTRVLRERPHVAVLIGNDVYHMLLARRLRSLGVHTVAVFPPQVWVWRWVAQSVARSFDLILASFPDEQRIYGAAGGSVSFVGHYLADVLSPVTRDDRDVARRALGLDVEGPVVGILPGSRTHELRLIGPALFDAVGLLAQRNENLRFALPAANDGLRGDIERELQRRGLQRLIQVNTDSLSVMRASDLILVASGTATLEATLLGVPMVIAYRLSRPTTIAVRIWLALGLIHKRVVGVPNLMLGRMAVPEVLGEQLNGTAIAAEAWRILSDPEEQRSQRTWLAEAASQLAGGGTIARIADAVIEQGEREVRKVRRAALAGADDSLVESAGGGG